MGRGEGGGGGGGVCCEGPGVSLSKTAPGADLGGCHKYSNESCEERSREGFQVNSSWCSAHAAFASFLKWYVVTIPTRTWQTHGGVKEVGDASGSFGKRCLYQKRFSNEI